MTENVSGYSHNPCSLNRERDAAFAAKLLTLPTGFFSREKSEEQMSGAALRHQPIHWRDSIWVLDNRHAQRRSQSVRSSRSVSFPIQRTRVTRVTLRRFSLGVMNEAEILDLNLSFLIKEN